MKKLALLGFLALMGASSMVQADPTPHFYVVMDNQTDQDVSISFKPVVGESSLTPGLLDHTPLAAHQQSEKYGVIFPVLGKDNTFNMIFTGKNDCAITVGFFSQGNPKIAMAGYGCNGAGYKVVGDTLFLYITGIHLKA